MRMRWYISNCGKSNAYFFATLIVALALAIVPSASASSPSLHPPRPLITPRPSIPHLHSPSNKPLVTLCMIVYNESPSIISTLNSVLGYVDRYSIVDTGSTDGTVKIMKQWLKKYHLSSPAISKIHRLPFVDFATTRNAALRLAGNETEFILFLNGDDRLVNGENMRAFLQPRIGLTSIDEAMYIMPINYGGISSGRSERLTRSSNHFVPDWPNDPINHWRYEGVTHEVYVNNYALKSGVEILYIPDHLFSIYHDITYDTGESKTQRFALDIKLLKTELDNPKNMNRARTLYYLAQSYYNLGDWSNAYKWFKERVEVKKEDDVVSMRSTNANTNDDTQIYDNEKSRSYLLLSSLIPRLQKPHSEMEVYLKKGNDLCTTSYSLMQLAKYYVEYKMVDEKEQRVDEEAPGSAKQLAWKYASLSRAYFLGSDPKYQSSLQCSDDSQLVAQQLPRVYERLGRRYE